MYLHSTAQPKQVNGHHTAYCRGMLWHSAAQHGTAQHSMPRHMAVVYVAQGSFRKLPCAFDCKTVGQMLQGHPSTCMASPRVESLSNFQTSHWVPLMKPPSDWSATNSPRYLAMELFTLGLRMMRELKYASACPVSPAPCTPTGSN